MIGLVASEAREEVVAVAAEVDVVASGEDVGEVVAIAAEDGVVALATVEGVVAGTALEPVVAAQAGQEVLAAQALECVDAGGAGQVVGTVGAGLDSHDKSPGCAARIARPQPRVSGCEVQLLPACRAVAAPAQWVVEQVSSRRMCRDDFRASRILYQLFPRSRVRRL
jgi:hypothetical protein